MLKIIIDMGSLDHLLIKSNGKFNVVATMSLQWGGKVRNLKQNCENSWQLFHQFYKIMENVPVGTIDGYMSPKL